MRITRRNALVVPLAFATAIGLAACSGGTSSGTATQTTGATAAGAASTLNIWADDTHIAALKTVVSTFEQQNGVKVNLIQKDGAKIVGDFIQQAPTGKGPDGFVTANDPTGNLVENGVVSPITIADPSAFSSVAIQALTYSGQTYGMPLSTENIALIRNTKLAPDAPSSFDDMITAGKALVSSGKAKYPFMVQSGTNGASDPYHLYPLQTSFGVPVFDTTSDGGYDATKLELGNSDGTKWASWLAKEGASKVLNPNYTYDIVLNAFNKGETPYIITGPWSLPKIKEAKISYAIEKVPSAGGQPSQPFVGVQAFFASKYSKNALLANKFAAYLGTQAAQVAFYKTGDRPPALTAAFDAVKSDADVAAFGAVGQAGAPLPNIQAMNSVWSSWGNTEGSIISGKASNPGSSWNSMATSIEKVIAKG